jgi:hypothetical protein
VFLFFIAFTESSSALMQYWETYMWLVSTGVTGNQKRQCVGKTVQALYNSAIFWNSAVYASSKLMFHS